MCSFCVFLLGCFGAIKMCRARQTKQRATQQVGMQLMGHTRSLQQAQPHPCSSRHPHSSLCPWNCRSKWRERALPHQVQALTQTAGPFPLLGPVRCMVQWTDCWEPTPQFLFRTMGHGRGERRTLAFSLPTMLSSGKWAGTCFF